jgi:uroporphyrinogen III methyltransferase/synthase
VFGRGGEEALALAEAGIPFEVVPGVSSAIAVPAYAGIPVTQRGMAGSVALIVGHRSAAEGDTAEQKAAPLVEADTRVYLMGVQNLPAIVESLLQSGCAADTPVAVIAQGSLPGQRVVCGTLGTIVERAAAIQPPAITVVGRVVELAEKLSWFGASPRKPLFGVRILNTRPLEARSRADLNDQLSRLGAEVLDLPCIQVAPAPDLTALDGSIQRLAEAAQPGIDKRIQTPPWDWIVFTSANAVDFFLGRLLEQGYDARILAGVRLGAVGEETSRRLGEYHLKADFIPSQYTGVTWAAEVEELDGKRVLLPRSGIAPDDLVQALERRKAVVQTVTAYTVVSAEVDESILRRLLDGDVDVVVLFSGSAVQGLREMVQRAAGAEQVVRVLSKPTLACVGPSTAKAVQKAGLKAGIIAEKYTVNGVVEALVKWRAP